MAECQLCGAKHCKLYPVDISGRRVAHLCIYCLKQCAEEYDIYKHEEKEDC